MKVKYLISLSFLFFVFVFFSCNKMHFDNENDPNADILGDCEEGTYLCWGGNEEKADYILLLCENNKYKWVENCKKGFVCKNGACEEIEEEPGPCDDNPCKGVENSTEKCIEKGETYSCECEDGFTWKDKKCLTEENDSDDSENDDEGNDTENDDSDADPGNNEQAECQPTEEKSCQDPETEYWWSTKSTEKMDWETAKTYCADLSEGGKTGWTLPTIGELRTLITSKCKASMPGSEECFVSDNNLDADFCGCTDSPDPDGGYSKFGDTEKIWSSSKYDSSAVWIIKFETAYIVNGSTESSNFVRCVITKK